MKNIRKKTITFGDILHIIDFSATMICYINDEETPVWEGFASNVPYWLAELPLNLDREDGEERAIDFRHSLGEKHSNKPGFVVCLKEENE